jgi:integrase/recombinase XerD
MYRIEHIVYLNQSAKTEEMSLCAMNSLIDYCGDIQVSDLTFDTVRKWKEHLSRSRHRNTVRGYILKLRVVLRYLKLKGHTDILNFEMVGVPKKKMNLVDFLTAEEVSIFLDTAFRPVPGYATVNRYRNRAIIAILYASGIRNSELKNLNISHLRFDTMTFSVIGKGDKPRLCFFDERSKSYIMEYLAIRDDTNPALFISNTTGERISSGIIQMIFRNVSEKWPVDKQVTPHMLRHSFATNLLRNNTNLLYVRDFLGHRSVQTTEMYTHVVDNDLKAIYEKNHTV